MAVSPSFRDFVLDQLGRLGPVDARPMFGGYGLYLEERFFGLLWGDAVYLKTDGTTRQSYLAEGMEPFSPGGKVALKNYYQVPVDVLEDSARFVEWAGASVSLTGSVPVTRKRRMTKNRSIHKQVRNPRRDRKLQND